MPKNRKGIVLIAVYIVIAILTILGAAFISRSISENRIAERERASTQAFYLAEAGVDLAIHELNYGNGIWSGWDTSGNPYTKTISSSDVGGLSTGDIDVSITDPTSNTPRVDAIGYTPNKTSFEGKRHVRAELEKQVSPAFDYCVITQKNLQLEDIETGIIGNIHSNGNIVIEEVNVTGTGTAVGTITIDEGGFSEGYQEGADTIAIPLLDMDYYQTSADYIHSGDWIVSDIFNISDYSANGIIYVDGNFKAEKATIVGPGIIVATNTITIEDEAIIGSADGIVGLFSDSDDSEEAIKIETDSSSYVAIFAPNGGVKIETDSSLYGSIMSDICKVETGGQLVYTDASGQINLPKSIYSISAWYEQ